MAVTTRTSSMRTAKPQRKRWTRRIPTVLRFLTLLVLTILFAFPFYWVILTSLVPSDHVYDFPPSLIPRWDFQNYVTAWQANNWVKYFLNTFFVAGASTVMVLVTSFLAGYAFAILRFPGKRFSLAIIFASLIMPAVVAIIPDFFIARLLAQNAISTYFGGLNTYWVQIVPWGASTFGIFLLMQFFRTMPTELWDAARMDGCSRLRYLWSIALPLSGPSMATIALFTFLGSYNSLLWPLVMTSATSNDPGVQPIEVGVYSFIGENGTAFNLLCAAAVFTTLPVVVLFLALQRTFVRGIMRTGIRG